MNEYISTNASLVLGRDPYTFIGSLNTDSSFLKLFPPLSPLFNITSASSIPRFRPIFTSFAALRWTRYSSLHLNDRKKKKKKKPPKKQTAYKQIGTNKQGGSVHRALLLVTLRPLNLISNLILNLILKLAWPFQGWILGRTGGLARKPGSITRHSAHSTFCISTMW